MPPNFTKNHYYFIKPEKTYLIDRNILRLLVEQGRFKDRFNTQSRAVIYDVTGMYEMSNDVRGKCLECHMTSRKYLQSLVTSEKNVTPQ